MTIDQFFNIWRDLLPDSDIELKAKLYQDLIALARYYQSLGALEAKHSTSDKDK